MNVTDAITSHLMEALKLSMTAEGSHPGNYALIAEGHLNDDGTILLGWRRYEHYLKGK